MKIAVIGLGYIGLPTALMFANHNQEVLGIDIDGKIINELNKGKIHIEEPGLQVELDKAVKNEKFKVSLKIEESDVYIVCVPTPNKNNSLKSCDLSHVLSAVSSIMPFLKKGNSVIIESTMAPNSTKKYILPLIESTGLVVGEDVFLVHCPERVMPGNAIHELIYNNRIIGGMTPKCTEAGKRIYSIFVKGEIIKSTSSVAEMSKLMENTYRDVNIAISNELVLICSELGINALDAIEIANKHPRVNFHQPGPGVGGHCLAVDPYFISAEAPKSSKLIQSSREINSAMPNFIIKNTIKLMDKIKGKKIAVFGVSYKGNSDDLRESPALEIVNRLKAIDKYDVNAYDPHVHADFLEKDISVALSEADLLVVLVDHFEFQSITRESLINMNKIVVFDTKNIIEKSSNIDKYFNLGNVYDIDKFES